MPEALRGWCTGMSWEKESWRKTSLLSIRIGVRAGFLYRTEGETLGLDLEEDQEEWIFRQSILFSSKA